MATAAMAMAMANTEFAFLRKKSLMTALIVNVEYLPNNLLEHKILLSEVAFCNEQHLQQNPTRGTCKLREETSSLYLLKKHVFKLFKENSMVQKKNPLSEVR